MIRFAVPLYNLPLCGPYPQLVVQWFRFRQPKFCHDFLRPVPSMLFNMGVVVALILRLHLKSSNLDTPILFFRRFRCSNLSNLQILFRPKHISIIHLKSLIDLLLLVLWFDLITFPAILLRLCVLYVSIMLFFYSLETVFKHVNYI